VQTTTKRKQQMIIAVVSECNGRTCAVRPEDHLLPPQNQNLEQQEQCSIHTALQTAVSGVAVHHQPVNCRASFDAISGAIRVQVVELCTNQTEELQEVTLEAMALQAARMRRAELKVALHFAVCAALYTVVEWGRVQAFFAAAVNLRPCTTIHSTSADGIAPTNATVAVCCNCTAIFEANSGSSSVDGAGVDGAGVDGWSSGEGSCGASSSFSPSCVLAVLGGGGARGLDYWYPSLFAVLGVALSLWLLNAIVDWFPRTVKFEHLCEGIFRKCSLGSDRLASDRLEASMLMLYDQINVYSPRHVHPPDHEEITQLLDVFDGDHDGSLSIEEWHEFTAFIYFQVVNDVALVLVIDLVVSPLYAILCHRALKACLFATPATKARGESDGDEVGGEGEVEGSYAYFLPPVALLVPIFIQALRKSILTHGMTAPRRKERLGARRVKPSRPHIPLDHRGAFNSPAARLSRTPPFEFPAS